MHGIARLIGIALIVPMLAASTAVAQPQPDAAARAEARERFARGLELYNEGQFQAALAEFQRAYDVAPAFQVLYNLGKVYAQLGDAVRSADAFEQYLREGGDGVPADRRAEVEAELERQRARIARVMVRTNVEGSTVTVDGADIATTPLDEPLRVTAGEHVIGARAPRHDAASRRVQLAGGVLETIELELHEVAEERGAIRVRSDVPGVEVRVDGDLVGTTPLEGTLSVDPGRHVVEGRRPGYEPARETVDVENAAEAVVRLDMRVDPEARPDELGRLRLRVPDAAFVLRVDGREVDAASGSLELPVGEHDVVLEVADREPVRETVDVPAGGHVDLEPEFEWTPAALEERRADAAALRRWGWWLTIGGAALTAIAGPAFVYFQTEHDSIADEREDLRVLFEMGCGGRDCSEEEQRYDDLGVELTTAFNFRNAAAAVATTGVLALGTGIVLLLVAPSEADIQAGAGLGSLWLTGTF